MLGPEKPKVFLVPVVLLERQRQRQRQRQERERLEIEQK